MVDYRKVSVGNSVILFTYSLSEERYQKGRDTFAQTAGCGAGATMMDDCRDVVKQPLVWTVGKIEHCIIRITTLSQLTPSTRNKRANSNHVNSFQYDICQGLRIFNHNTTKTYVHRWRSGFKKGAQIRWRLIRKWFSKEEATDVFERSVAATVSRKMVAYLYVLASLLAVVLMPATNNTYAVLPTSLTTKDLLS